MFVSWIGHHGRSEALAAALDVSCRFIATGRQGQRALAPLRYLVQSVRTIAALGRERPRVLFVMAPPLPLVVIGLAYQALARRPVVIDAHTGAVLRDGRPRSAFLRLARRARATVVTTERLADIVRGAGVRTVVVGDPPLATAAPAPTREAASDRPVVVWPCSWYHDEPVAEVIAAAALVPDVDVALTGRPPAPFDRGTLPPNVRLTGWLDDDAYGRLLASATGVLALTTRDFTMQRAGYEALILGLPLVASDTAVLRDYFDQGAVFAAPDAQSLANAITTCVRERDRLAAEMADLRAEKQSEFGDQLRALSAAVA